MPIRNELSIIHEGEDIVYPVLDAITFGILWEQETPSYYRTDPTNSHIRPVRQFDSTDDVIDAQNEQLAVYFRYFKETHDHSLEEDIDPPAASYMGVELSDLLHQPILFGELLEMWYADGPVEEHGDSSVSMGF